MSEISSVDEDGLFAGEGHQNPMDLALTWIGFDSEANRNTIMENIAEFADMADMTEKDLKGLSDGFSARTLVDGRFHFGLARLKRLKAMVHWVQDFARISETPTLIGLNQARFRTALTESATRALIRVEEASRSSTLSREAAPGKLKDGKKWNDWKTAMENMLATIPGVSGIPLSYVTRANDAREPEGHDNFVQQCVACAPLAGPHFEADARQVHQLILSAVQGEESEQWIKPTKRAQNGRLDYKALVAHYEGEGNTSRRIAEAERIKKDLHYKSERSLSFASFLAKLQLMFNIFNEEGEPYTDSQRLRTLFEKVQHPDLAPAINALKVRETMESNSVTFTIAANHLASEVSQLPEYIATKRHVAALGAGASASNDRGIYAKDGSIFTGYIKTWSKLSQEDRDLVMAERQKKGVKPGSRKKRTVSAAATKKSMANITKQLETAKRSIAALKKASEAQTGGEDADAVTDNAGNAFGGRAAKKGKSGD